MLTRDATETRDAIRPFGGVRAGERPSPHLSPRQAATLKLILQGNSEKQIAMELGLSSHTVHIYCKELHRKFNVCSRGELISLFVDWSVAGTLVRGDDPATAEPKGAVTEPDVAARAAEVLAREGRSLTRLTRVYQKLERANAIAVLANVTADSPLRTELSAALRDLAYVIRRRGSPPAKRAPSGRGAQIPPA